MVETLNYDDLEGSEAEVKSISRNFDGDPIAMVLEIDGREIYVGSSLRYYYEDADSILNISYNR